VPIYVGDTELVGIGTAAASLLLSALQFQMSTSRDTHHATPPTADHAGCLVSAAICGTVVAGATGIGLYRRVAAAGKSPRSLPLSVSITGVAVAAAQLWACRRDDKDRRAHLATFYISRNSKLYGQRFSDFDEWAATLHPTTPVDPASLWYGDLKRLTEFRLPVVKPGDNDHLR
jgi:hypothetical protein